MKKRTLTLWVLLTPLILLTGIMAILLSPLGAPVIRFAAVSIVPGLQVEKASGSVLGNFSVSDVKWENPTWDVSLASAELNIGLECLMSTQVCIDSLNVTALTVTQHANPPTAREDESSESFSMPVKIRWQNVSLSQTTVALTDQRFTVSKLTTKGSANEIIHLEKLAISDVEIHLPESDAPSTQGPEKPTSYALSYSAPDLPDVQLPIPITVDNFSLSNTQILKGDAPFQTISLVSMKQLAMKQSELNIKELHVEHKLGTLNLTGHTTLSDNYPLEVKSHIAFRSETMTENVDLNMNGALDALNLKIRADGLYNAEINGNANVLSNTLPLDLTVTWPEQALPTMQEGKLWQGNMTLKGAMGNYQLNAKSGADIPDIGPVPVDADVVLNKKNVTVNRLQIDILAGTIANTGTLYLNDMISWSGKTTLSGISTTRLIAGGPTQLTGEFTSLMQLANNKPEMSITNLNIQGQQGEYPLDIQGALVYSMGSDLMVANLTLNQQENQVRIAGQIFNNRYLNANINIDLSDTSRLYPQVSGAVSGKIRAYGEWQNPTADGDIALTDVRISPSLNVLAAEQGALNGTIGIKGQLSQHDFVMDLTLPDHRALIDMTGKWQSNKYTADIHNSELGILTTRWTLSNPFTVSVQPDPLDLTVTTNCWSSREQGKLCIDDAQYRNDKATWQLNADSLPLGLWASELAPELITAPPEATLSITTSGELGQDTSMKAQFNAQISPATWALGANKQIALDIDSVRAQGHIENDTLTSNVTLQSQQLGGIEANLNVDKLFDDSPKSLSGEVNLNDIRVAPLKPLSPAIRELAGTLNGSLSLSGDVSDIQINGDVKLSNGNLDVEDMPVTIGDWQQTIAFRGQSADFNGEFMLGEGKGSLHGDVDWSDALTANLNLKGNRFEIRQRDIRMKVSPDITANLTPEKVKVSGNVNIPWARVVIEELPDNAVSPSKDVHLRGEPPSGDPLDRVDATVMVNIDKDKSGEVKLEAFGLTANLHGGIEVRTQPALVGYGDLQVLDGRYQAYGQDLIIQTGEVQFNGPIDQPMLLVEAIRDPDKTEDGVIAGIRIDGAADSPNINLFSEPAMNQSSSLSYLLTGRGPGASSSEPNYNALLLGFGLSRTEKLQGAVGNALGIEEFSIGTTSSAGSGSTKLQLSGRINDRLTVQYNVDVGLSNNNSTTQTLRRRQEPPDLALRYRLLPKLFVEAVQTTIEEQTEFAVDFYYEFFLGKPDENEVTDDDSAQQTPSPKETSATEK